MNAAACPNTKCSQIIHFDANTKLPFTCSNCDHFITEKHYQLYRDVDNATRMHLDNMKLSNIACEFGSGKCLVSFSRNYFLFDPVLDVCSVLIHKQTGILHQMNIYRLKTLDLAFESAIDVGKWDEALRYGNDLLPGFR